MQEAENPLQLSLFLEKMGDADTARTTTVKNKHAHKDCPISLLTFLLNLRKSKADSNWSLLGGMHYLPLTHPALVLCFSTRTTMKFGGFMLSELTIESKGLSPLQKD